MSDKKDYQNVLVALDRDGTISATLNQLSKVQQQTEDKSLQTALENLAAAVRQQFPDAKTGRLRSVDKTKYPKFASGVERLRQYCQAAIDSTDPQWMILARRAGWTPPASK